MCKGVCFVVSSAANTAADKTYPEIEFRMAYAAFARASFVEESDLASSRKVVECISAYGTPAAFPFLQTCAMKDMLTDDSQ